MWFRTKYFLHRAVICFLFVTVLSGCFKNFYKPATLHTNDYKTVIDDFLRQEHTLIIHTSNGAFQLANPKLLADTSVILKADSLITSKSWYVEKPKKRRYRSIRHKHLFKELHLFAKDSYELPATETVSVSLDQFSRIETIEKNKVGTIVSHIVGILSVAAASFVSLVLILLSNFSK